MRLIVARMIANGSLAAFSALVQPAAPATSRPLSPVVRIAAAPVRAPADPPVARPGQPLPRGSLLDLKV